MDFKRFWDAPDHQMLAVLISITFFAMIVEIIVQRKSYDLRDMGTNLLMYAGSFLINMSWVPIVYQIFVLVHDHSIFKIGEGFCLWSSCPGARSNE